MRMNVRIKLEELTGSLVLPSPGAAEIEAAVLLGVELSVIHVELDRQQQGFLHLALEFG